MRWILVMLATVTVLGCSTYKGSEIWRRSICEKIVDVDERAKCLQDATRPENEYKQDIEGVTGERNII
ncbi:MAG: hypothetical protein AB8B64_23100 [Granulosicoccus sp.]